MLVHSADEMRPKQDGGPGELLVCATEPDLLLGGGEGPERSADGYTRLSSLPPPIRSSTCRTRGKRESGEEKWRE